jgi:hypothetical protein
MLALALCVLTGARVLVRRLRVPFARDASPLKGLCGKRYYRQGQQCGEPRSREHRYWARGAELTQNMGLRTS